jgi:RimJ/RimL family protein N-acetyltransferase
MPAQHFRPWRSRARLLQWLPWAAGHQTIEETREFIMRAHASAQAGEDVNGGVFARGDGRFLGGLGLHLRNLDVATFEIGYWLRSSAEGHGYIGEAVGLVQEFAARQRGANCIVIRCDVRNVRSAAVAERAGFLRAGLLRNHVRSASGELHSIYVYSLTPADARWPRPR